MNQIDELLIRIERLKEMGALNEALEFLTVMQQKLPLEYIKIQIEILEIKYLQGLYEETLFDALSYIKESDVYKWVMRKYYEPFAEEHHQMYQRNIKLLEKYQYFYGDIGTDQYKIFWFDETGKLIFERPGQIGIYTNTVIFDDSKETVLVCNMLEIDKLLEYKAKTDDNKGIPNYQEPIYLYYTQNIFGAIIQCLDLTSILDDCRVVLLIGEENLVKFFEYMQAIMPKQILGKGKERVDEVLQEISKRKFEKGEIDLQQMQDYYARSEEQIMDRIRSHRPRILFLTSRFTTILQYHTRDCRKAARKMGLETELEIEKGTIFQINGLSRIAIMNSFRPDIIFCIDHLRLENGFVPKQIVWICWVQDPLFELMNSYTPAKLGRRDFVLNHFTSWKTFKKVGYSSDALIDAPIPASSDIYQIYELSKEEYDKFTCDICFVCHGSDVDAHIQKFVSQGLSDYQQEIVKLIYKGYQQYVYRTGDFFYSKELFEEFVKEFFIEYYGEKVKSLLSGLVGYLAEDMYLWYNQRVFRQTLVDWMLDAGFTNIKLWGNGWKDNVKYQAYAMGPAENGKTLSKIYQASKIVIGNNITTTTAARAWETMLSGGFYMSNYVPEEEDISDIRKIVEIGKDMIMFYGKEDLIEKIKYYLEHEDERQIMIERGRKVALEKMTFDILMKRTLSEVAKRLEE